MMTLFGKILVFVMALTSLGAVGVAVFLAADTRDFKKELEATLQEYSNREAQARIEARALAQILTEKEVGAREMPWDIEAQLFGGKVKSVMDTKGDLKTLDKEINKLTDDKNTKVDSRNALLDEIRKQRDETEKALAEQKRLREIITPGPNAPPNAKAFRDLLEEYRTAKLAAEDQLEKIRPDLFNESVRVSIQLKRQEELQKRLQELKAKQAVSAQP